jgi:hypothetical protein
MSKVSRQRLLEVREIISGHTDAILREFKPGAKITVLARIPGNDDADMLLTNDDLEQVAAAIERSKTRQPP